MKLSISIGTLLAESCVNGITANEDRCKAYFDRSLALATILNPYIGYDRAAEVAKKALARHKTIREVILEEGILDEEELESILDHERLTSLNIADKNSKD
jgi:aspartate ammonia-lyase